MENVMVMAWDTHKNVAVLNDLMECQRFCIMDILVVGWFVVF